jgi:plasmid segregation protein ParM
VVAYEKEPIFTADALFYNGTYYGIGEDHKEFIPDRMTDQDYYILTLAAIVRELERANMRTVDVPGLLLRGAPQVVSRRTEK